MRLRFGEGLQILGAGSDDSETAGLKRATGEADLARWLLGAQAVLCGVELADLLY
jgi:hypothetical protein